MSVLKVNDSALELLRNLCCAIKVDELTTHESHSVKFASHPTDGSFGSFYKFKRAAQLNKL